MGVTFVEFEFFVKGLLEGRDDRFAGLEDESGLGCD